MISLTFGLCTRILAGWNLDLCLFVERLQQCVRFLQVVEMIFAVHSIGH